MRSDYERTPPSDSDDLLERVRAVAQRINERVRKATADTGLDIPSLPTDRTDAEHTPLPPEPPSES